MTTRQKKRDLIEQARRAGWTGRSYRKAKQFERKLEHTQRAYAAWIDEERAGSVPQYEIPERRPRRSWRRWFLKARRRA